MLHKISEHLWYLEQDTASDRPALGYVRGRDRAFAVDAGASCRHVALFYDSLLARDLPLPDFTGISHYHWDHSYGAAFVQGVTLASDRCARHLEEESAWAWTRSAMAERLQNGQDIPFGYYSKLAEYADLTEIRVRPPAMALSGDAAIDLGGVTVQVLYCGGPHSDDHLIFFIPEDRFLFLGDASGKELFTLEWDYDPGHPERLQDCLAQLPYNQSKLRPFVALLEKLDFTHCLFAHADGLWTRDFLLENLRASLD